MLSPNSLRYVLDTQPPTTGTDWTLVRLVDVLAHWHRLADLRDNGLSPALLRYRPAAAVVAVGSFPCNCCDVFRDHKTGHLRLSYTEPGEWGTTWRVTHALSAQTPVLAEPVSAKLLIAHRQMQTFRAFVADE